MKYFLLIVVLLLILMLTKVIRLSTLITIMNVPFTRYASAQKPQEAHSGTQTLYDFKLKKLVDGSELDLSGYKGKKVILLNVASECGYTPQYADWQKFHETFGEKIVVIGIPSNEFGGQEPGSSQDIATFCQKNYGVTFPMAEKAVVKGEGKHPLYQWLTTKSLNGWNDKEPGWNFCKYVINEKGQLTHFFGSKILPTDPEFMAAVK